MNQALLHAGTFIGGHPKSGTSLLLTLLDSHPQLVVYPEETEFFYQFLPQARGLSFTAQAAQAEARILHIFHWDPVNPHSSQAGYPDRDYTAFEYERVRAAFRRWLAAFGEGEAHILPAAILAYGEVSGQLSADTRRWVEKTPHHEHAAEQIFSAYDDARFIQTVRDPRDNYASYRRKQPEWGPEYFALSWRRSFQRGLENQRRYGSLRYLMIRYEDLVLETPATLETIRQFLGIQDDPALLQPTRAGVNWGGNSMFGQRFEGVSERPIGRYKESLGRENIQRIEAALVPEMERLGYEPESPPSLAARAVWMGYRARRALIEWSGRTVGGEGGRLDGA